MVLAPASVPGVLKTVLMFPKGFGAAGLCTGLANGDLDRDRDRDRDGLLWWLRLLWCRWLWLLCSRDGECDSRWLFSTLLCRFVCGSSPLSGGECARFTPCCCCCSEPAG